MTIKNRTRSTARVAAIGKRGGEVTKMVTAGFVEVAATAGGRVGSGEDCGCCEGDTVGLERSDVTCSQNDKLNVKLFSNNYLSICHEFELVTMEKTTPPHSPPTRKKHTHRTSQQEKMASGILNLESKGWLMSSFWLVMIRVKLYSYRPLQ